MKKQIAAALALVCLAIAGCSSGGDDTQQKATTGGAKTQTVTPAPKHLPPTTGTPTPGGAGGSQPNAPGK